MLCTELTHCPWFLNWGKAFQPSFLHWSLLVGAISVGAVSDEVKLSVNVAADPMILTLTFDVPSSWKFPLGVWIVAVYGAPVVFSLAPEVSEQRCELASPSVLLPVIVVVPEAVVNVALNSNCNTVQLPDSVNVPG